MTSKGRYELLNEYVLPLLNIEKIGDTNGNPKNDISITKANKIEPNRFNIEIEYCPRGLPFDDINSIDRNYYVKSIHSFVFLKPIDCNGTFRRIFEVPSDLAEELEEAFDIRLRKASISYELRVLWDRFVRLFYDHHLI